MTGKAPDRRSSGDRPDEAAWLHLAHDVFAGKVSRYGQTYEIRATLVGPSGRSAEVVTIWFVPAGEKVLRFVTTYPEDPAAFGRR